MGPGSKLGDDTPVAGVHMLGGDDVQCGRSRPPQRPRRSHRTRFDAGRSFPLMVTKQGLIFNKAVA
ncbi:MAG: hypothetical protein MZV64_16580 [Ignavibacteriales bacterium]|nr:hypothetical protein [Ignavibacteriales bacterium]